MDEDSYEKHGGSVSVCITKESSIVHIAHDMLNTQEGKVYMWSVMHRQSDTGNQLDRETHTGEKSVIPE